MYRHRIIPRVFRRSSISLLLMHPPAPARTRSDFTRSLRQNRCSLPPSPPPLPPSPRGSACVGAPFSPGEEGGRDLVLWEYFPHACQRQQPVRILSVLELDLRAKQGRNLPFLQTATYNFEKEKFRRENERENDWRKRGNAGNQGDANRMIFTRGAKNED